MSRISWCRLGFADPAGLRPFICTGTSLTGPSGRIINESLVVRFACRQNMAATSFMRSHASLLVDTFGRRIEYLRLSVTDRCDLRCTYCIPKGFRGFQEPASWLRFEEIERLISIMAPRGLKRVRLTGGEPLVRRDLPDLAARLAAIPGIDDLSLSTNATRLHALAAPLKEAGVRRVNVSLDSLRSRSRRRDLRPGCSRQNPGRACGRQGCRFHADQDQYGRDAWRE